MIQMTLPFSNLTKIRYDVALALKKDSTIGFINLEVDGDIKYLYLIIS